jgi:uncharacterized OB-fold protein
MTLQAKDQSDAFANDPETGEYWKATADGRLVVKRCRACREAHFYPRPICPFCFSDATEWQVTSGIGTIYSYSIDRTHRPPIVIAYVELEEGIRILTNITGCQPEHIRISARVKVLFVNIDDGRALPMFTLS